MAAVTWLAVLALAAGALALALAALPPGGRRGGWATLAAVLALGLAGYATQARPDLPGAPARPRADATGAGPWLKAARQDFVAPADRSRSPLVLTADAFAARGRYADAAALLAEAVARDPEDAEAWLALANVLVEHAGGRLTEPALLAFRRAAAADPSSVAPAYFLGFALIRQGSVMDGRTIWADALGTPGTTPGTAPDDPARAALAQRLARLDALLRQLSADQPPPAPPPSVPPQRPPL